MNEHQLKIELLKVQATFINFENYSGVNYTLINELGQELQKGVLLNTITQCNIDEKGIFILILTNEQNIVSKHKIVVI